MLARLQLWFLVAAALGTALAPSSVAAQQHPNALTVKAAHVGVGGVCKSGFWAPIWLDLVAGPEGARGNLEIIVPDGDNVPVIYSDENAADVKLAANQEVRILRYAKIGPENAPILLRLRDGDRVVWSQSLVGLPARLAATAELIVGIGPDLDLKAALATIRRSPDHSRNAVQTKSAGDLPDRWWGYDGVDTVVLATSDAKQMESITVEQSAALLKWIRLGGRLVVSVGSRGSEFSAEGSPWAAILPGELIEVSALRERAGLEAQTGVELPWDSDDFQLTRPLVSRLAEIDGAVLLDEVGSGTNRPLIIKSAYGLGEVVFVGLDLDHPGFANWAGRPKLLATLLARSHGRAQKEEVEVRRGITHLGYDDLVGQLRAALDQFPGVTLVSFTTVSVLTAVYLLLIGPGDYLLLSRFNIPRQVTWFTFALVALVFAITAWLVGRTAHGDRVRTNQLEIVDLDGKSGTVRGTGWTHLYSPATARFSAEPLISADRFESQDVGGILAWQGLPGNSLGGLASGQTVLATADPYRIRAPGSQPGVVDLPVQSASSKGLSVRWWGQSGKPVSSSLVRNEHGALDGELTNPLPIALTDSLVAFEDRLYRLGKLQPGQMVSLGTLTPLNLEARLTELTFEGSKEVSTVWKRDSNDLPRIVQMLMFHESARGRTYTGLTHRYQPYLDLSGHLGLGRAVLVGKAAEPITRLVDGSELAHQDDLAQASDRTALTWCRVIFPVRLQPSPTSQP
jgi:hypothetical protein